MVQETLSRHTFIDISNLHYDLDLERCNAVFHRTLKLVMMYHKTKFTHKQINSIEDIVETVIF